MSINDAKEQFSAVAKEKEAEEEEVIVDVLLTKEDDALNPLMRQVSHSDMLLKEFEVKHNKKLMQINSQLIESNSKILNGLIVNNMDKAARSELENRVKTINALEDTVETVLRENCGLFEVNKINEI